jgi:hypothetical protein
VTWHGTGTEKGRRRVSDQLYYYGEFWLIVRNMPGRPLFQGTIRHHDGQPRNFLFVFPSRESALHTVSLRPSSEPEPAVVRVSDTDMLHILTEGAQLHNLHHYCVEKNIFPSQPLIKRLAG